MSHTIVQEYQKKFAKAQFPAIKPGMTVKVTQKFKEGGKERVQIFQGVVIKLHEKTSLNATFTVRKVVGGVGVEKLFPVHLPTIEVEVLRGSHVSRAKLYYLRDRGGKSARLKERSKEFADLMVDIPLADIIAAEVEANPYVEPVAEEAVTTEAPTEAKIEEPKMEDAIEEPKTEDMIEEPKMEDEIAEHSEVETPAEETKEEEVVETEEKKDEEKAAE